MATARAALAAEAEGEGPTLQWTENMPPSEDCRYDHCTAETPFGQFLISWKSWKQFDRPTVAETPWGDWYGAFDSVDEAKSACQEEMDKRLTRWGRPATPPAPEVGEVEELVRRLRDWHSIPLLEERERAATLLSQLSAPALAVVPVAVSERLPGEGDCDAEGRCWCFAYDGRVRGWTLRIIEPGVYDTHWLPAHAIPMPHAGEGEA
jgi:hypothetical protein